MRLLSLYSPLPESIPALLQVVQTTTGAPKELETNSMLAFRALANCFLTLAGKSLVKDEAAEVRTYLAACLRYSSRLTLGGSGPQIIDTLTRRGFAGVSKNGKVALATIILK